MKYLVIDTFDNTQKIVGEEELRNMYDKLLDEIIFNWKDCGDDYIISGLKKEKEAVYTASIDFVIKTIMEDDKWIEIKEVR